MISQMSNIQLYTEMIENRLLTYLPGTEGELSGLPDMLAYSLSGGGKRIRPLLCLEFCAAAGGSPESALPFACAVEFIHTYSLIHDDLPCMDNDDLRRGKPSSHIKFGEANALLAGDALLTHAFGIAADAALSGTVSYEASVRAIAELSRLAGLCGMIGGQFIDLKYENKNAGTDVLFTMDALKTSALIEAACVTGLLAAGTNDEQLRAAHDFALAFGLAFQITDDILEEEADGVSSDVENGKSTYVSLLGIEKAREAARSYTDEALEALALFGNEAEEIREIAKMLLNRKK